MNFPCNCQAHLDSLARSPSFAMSIGAKELFHTNFLAFLLESQEPCIQSIQKKLKELFFGHNKVGRVITWREKNSLDLVIMPAPKGSSCEKSEESRKAELDYNCDCRGCSSYDEKSRNYCSTIAVVIEAKLKSTPTQQQLDKYNQALSDGISFDLDDADTVDVSHGKGQRRWQAMKLKLAASEGMCKCKSDCTIEARGKAFSGNSTTGTAEKIGFFAGKLRRLLLLPSSAEPGGRLACWEKMSWQCVVDALKCDREHDPCAFPSETAESRSCKATELLRKIVCDYRDSLANLLAILKETNDYVTTSVHPSGGSPSTTYGDYYHAITDPGFKRHRIHDLVGKYASHVLEEHVMAIVGPALGNTGGHGAVCADCCVPAGESSGRPFVIVCGFPFELDSYTHFSNQQPGVGFEWAATKKVGKKERRVSFGVQIQGHSYRHFICVEGGDARQRASVLHSLQSRLDPSPVSPTGWWFLDTTVFQGNNPPTLELRSLPGRSFFVFGVDSFRYSKADIMQLPMTDLAHTVCRSLCLARRISGSPPGQPCTEIREFLEIRPM